MGEKDYQQCMVVNRLLEVIHSRIVLHTCPTVREPDGLAMSSRNVRLIDGARKKAGSIYIVLKYLKDNLKPGNLDHLKNTGKMRLEENEIKTDYLTIVDATTLEEVNSWDGKQKLVALMAGFVNDIRLIDNMILNGKQTADQSS